VVVYNLDMDTTSSHKEAATINTHITTITPAEPETTYRDGAYRIDCSVCGTVHTYRGFYFTQTEATRHARYFNTDGK
jgi:hypothetical protein